MSLFTVFPDFVRNILYSKNAKYRHLVYYFLVITPFCAVLRTRTDAT
jgi:vesicle coat complex subunit